MAMRNYEKSHTFANFYQFFPPQMLDRGLEKQLRHLTSKNMSNKKLLLNFTSSHCYHNYCVVLKYSKLLENASKRQKLKCKDVGHISFNHCCCLHQRKHADYNQ